LFRKAGILYADPTEECLNRAVEQFDTLEAKVDPAALRAYAERFSEARFAEEFGALVAIPGSGRMPVL